MGRWNLDALYISISYDREKFDSGTIGCDEKGQQLFEFINSIKDVKC